MGESTRDSRGLVAARLRERRSELEAAVTTRVLAFDDPAAISDPLYDDLTTALRAAVGHSLAGLERAGRGTPDPPAEIVARIPVIAGGAGAVTKFQLEVGRKFSYRGSARSFLTATCPTGRWATRGEAGFADGTQLRIPHVFPCTPTA